MNIDVRELKKSYFLDGKEIPVLNDLSFDIKAGDLISLTGPSGVGKSTLLHLLGTLDSPTSGSIFYDNQSLKQWTDTKIAGFRNEKIGYVFQFHHLMSEFTAVENVAMPLLLRRQTVAAAKSEAQKILGYVGLSHRSMHKPGELSGGEQQRVALARALVHYPSLLLADEPTGNLDEGTGKEIINLILDFNRQHNTTVVLVTHNHALSQQFAKKWVLTAQGISY